MSGFVICRPSPTRELRRDSLGERWCFVCRRRVEFVYILTTEIEMSYYDPWPSIECVAGHVSGDLFPGRVREWE